MIKIAVLGYGTVGSGVVEVIQTNKESIKQRIGEELDIKYILDCWNKLDAKKITNVGIKYIGVGE